MFVLVGEEPNDIVKFTVTTAVVTRDVNEQHREPLLSMKINVQTKPK